ncbi:MAG: DNA phosphorothioation system sulfurtransferase DndC [Prevotella sp.]|nr:DNA phosphorothioation system sulfurtransferase DndC [Prevotella sp.]
MSEVQDRLSIDELIDEIEYVYQSDDRPWIIGYSGGKDSTTVVHLVYEMLKRLAPEKRKKPVHIVSSDTLVENPLIKEYLDDMLHTLRESAERDSLPIIVKKVTPDPNNSFWANIIGRGFPTPRTNGTFRWCTDRLKIAPSGKYIEAIIREQNTEVVVLLGVRKAESAARKRRIEGRELLSYLLNRHETIKGAFVYPAIVSLSTEDVWDILMSNGRKNAWGGDNSRLIELYAGADSGECPFAGFSTKEAQQQSCGQSRFGCWVCTVVKEDKSLNGFIRSGHRELIPLAEFRKWLMSIRDIPEYREKKHRDGTVYRTANNELGVGPFTWEARQMILRELLRVQRKMRYELITLDELREIDQIWDEEQDLSRRTLVNIYFEEIGKRLPWDELKAPVFDENTCAELERLARENQVPMELLKGMIFKTNKTKFFSNTKVFREALTKTVTQQWLQEAELVNAEEGIINEN